MADVHGAPDAHSVVEYQPQVVERSPMFALIDVLDRAILDRHVDVTKLHEIVKLQRDLLADHARVEFNRAYHQAQAKIPQVEKNGTINLGKGKDGKDMIVPFTTIEDIDLVLRPIMNEHGFSLSFDTVPREGGGLLITATLTHTLGHQRMASMSLPLDSGPGRNNLQAYASTLSYGRRYTTEMLWNIIRKGVDDDGKAAGIRHITQEDAALLREKCKAAKRDEGALLDKMFRGLIHTFDELEVGGQHIAVLSTIEGIINLPPKAPTSGRDAVPTERS